MTARRRHGKVLPERREGAGCREAVEESGEDEFCAEEWDGHGATQLRRQGRRMKHHVNCIKSEKPCGVSTVLIPCSLRSDQERRDRVPNATKNFPSRAQSHFCQLFVLFSDSSTHISSYTSTARTAPSCAAGGSFPSRRRRRGTREERNH